MATVQEIMIDAIAKAYRSAEQITTNVDRAKAFTDLATACAAALSAAKPTDETVVTAMPAASTPAAKTVKKSSKKPQENVSEQPAVSQSKEPEPAKDQSVTTDTTVSEEKSDIKDKVKEKEKPAVAEKASAVETTAEDTAAAEENFTEEWTLNALEYFKDEIAEIERYQDMFANDVDSLNLMISEATDKHCTSVDEITPLNIKLILAYIKSLEENSGGKE